MNSTADFSNPGAAQLPGKQNGPPAVPGRKNAGAARGVGFGPPPLLGPAPVYPRTGIILYAVVVIRPGRPGRFLGCRSSPGKRPGDDGPTWGRAVQN